MIGVLLAVIAGLVAVSTGIVSSGDVDAYEVADVPIPPPVFEPAGQEGADPFFPLDVQLAGFEEQAGESPTQQAVASGLYGGTAQNTCDPQRLVDYLMSHPDKGRAWAHVQGIQFDEIPAYIGALTVRVLAQPTTVLNHGFDATSGAPYEIETTLDAGTAVLVDAAGDIRTRCYCGNPIKPKPVGHRPPRCLQVPTMVYSQPSGNSRRDGVPSEVLLTGRVTSDQMWTEISWGPAESQTGWTPPTNLHRYLCFVVLPPPIVTTPTPTPTWTPTPTPTWTPGPTPTPTWTPTPTPTWTPGPTPTPTPTWTPTPTPTPTPSVQPLQINCFITATDLKVGEQTEYSAFHVPGTVPVTYAFDHGDGTIDRRNPSIAFYNNPGSYDVYVIATVEGTARRQFCGTIDVTTDGADHTVWCSIEKTRIAVGERTTFEARTSPSAGADFAFEHGDGTIDRRNPSLASYNSPGSYHVYVESTYQGQTKRLFCGTVEVSAGGVATCGSADYIGMNDVAAGNMATSRGCAWRVATRAGVPQPGTTDVRSDRVNFDVNSHGIVTGARIG